MKPNNNNTQQSTVRITSWAAKRHILEFNYKIIKHKTWQNFPKCSTRYKLMISSTVTWTNCSFLLLCGRPTLDQWQRFVPKNTRSTDLKPDRGSIFQGHPVWFQTCLRSLWLRLSETAERDATPRDGQNNNKTGIHAPKHPVSFHIIISLFCP